MGKAPVLLGGAVLSKVGWLLFLALLGRSIGVDGLGAFALAQTVVLVFVDIATPLNVNVALRHGAVRERDGDLSRLLGLIASTLVIVAAPAAAFLWLAGPWIGSVAFDSDEVGDALRWLALFLPALAAQRLAAQLLVVDGRVHLRVAIIDVLPVPVFLLAATLADEASQVAVGYGIAIAIATSASWALLISRHKIRFSDIRTELAEIRQFSTDVYLMANANNAARLGDILLVGAVLDVRAAGIYAAATTLASGSDLVTKSISTAIGPATAVELDEDRVADARRTYETATVAAVALVAVGCVAAWVGGDAFLSLLYGPEFVDGWWALALLVLAGATRAATTGSSTILTNGGMHRRELIHVIFGGVLTILLVPVLGVALGLVGIALGRLVATLAVQALREHALLRLFRSRSGLARYPGHHRSHSWACCRRLSCAPIHHWRRRWRRPDACLGHQRVARSRCIRPTSGITRRLQTRIVEVNLLERVIKAFDVACEVGRNDSLGPRVVVVAVVRMFG